MTPSELVAERFRQIHLDFHTSPDIPDIGSEFDPDQFGDTLTAAHVNWITLFGKCHHGMSYYPTKSKLGVIHPGLKFDLLGQQIEACKRRGIAAPVYLSARVDQNIGLTRSDLVARLEDGRLWGPKASEAGWYQVCMNNSEYIDYLAEQTVEVLKNYDADGVFYDMCYYPPYPGCFCEKCLKRLRDSGHRRDDAAAHYEQTYQILREYTTRLTRVCQSVKPNATTFFNSRVTINMSRELDILTHLEIESLTTGGWGYLFYPCWSRMLRTYPRPLQGMTARFHKSWADFGGLKTVPQLDYEAGTILAAGGVMSIGDQLHPRGRLDQGAYKLIGEVYAKVEQDEPYLKGAQPMADIGVLLLPTPEARIVEGKPELEISHSIEGTAAALSALKHQWNGESADRDNLANYKTLIIPDEGILDESMQSRLKTYLDEGGTLLFSHEATLKDGAFQLPYAPVKYLEKCPYTPSYMRLGEKLGADLPDSEIVNYRDGSYVTPADGAEAFGEVWQPYFNRQPGLFSSHNQTPVDKPTGHPVAVVSADSRIAYLYAAGFQGYREDAFYIYKELIGRMLARLLPEPLVRPLANIPAAMEISVLEQKSENRLVVNLVNFQPQRRTAANEFIESVVPIRDVTFALRTGSKPSRVFLAPNGVDLPFEQDGAYSRVTVPSIETRQLVVFVR